MEPPVHVNRRKTYEKSGNVGTNKRNTGESTVQTCRNNGNMQEQRKHRGNREKKRAKTHLSASENHDGAMQKHRIKTV